MGEVLFSRAISKQEKIQHAEIKQVCRDADIEN